MTGTPKNLPATAWTVCFVEHAPKKGETAGIDSGFAKRAAQAYRNMSPEEHEVSYILCLADSKLKFPAPQPHRQREQSEE
jgi:hypothetical protein